MAKSWNNNTSERLKNLSASFPTLWPKNPLIGLNSVLPGPTMTEGVRDFIKNFAKEQNIPSEEEAMKSYFQTSEPTSLIQRFLEPDEVANAALYLGSAMGSGTNGAAFRVEGGIIRHM